MKKYLIHYMCVDTPSVDDDGIGCGTNFGILMEQGNKIKFFDSKEDAQKYLEETIIPEDKANLEGCYGFDDEDCEPTVYITVEKGNYGRTELVVTDKYDATEINTTIYEIVEVEF